MLQLENIPFIPISTFIPFNIIPISTHVVTFYSDDPIPMIRHRLSATTAVAAIIIKTNILDTILLQLCKVVQRAVLLNTK